MMSIMAGKLGFNPNTDLENEEEKKEKELKA